MSEDYPEYADLNMREKRRIIREKIDELRKLVLQYDMNNVGMSWPDDVHRAQVLSNLKEYYEE